ncbi:MAG: FAD-binding oxidoreductase [Acidobacteriota bacterium]
MPEKCQMKWYGWGSAEKTFDLSRRRHFWPYLNEKLGLSGEERSLPVELDSIKLPNIDTANLVTRFAKLLGANAVHTDQLTRVTHAAGKSYLDLIRVRLGLLESAPDLVLYPENEAQVLAILQLAAEARIAVIPFGGGTSVVGGVEALKRADQIATVSLDLSCLNRLAEIDEVSLLANIEAGIRGPELERQLQQRGYTLGHYPQSFEFSTLGGWVATRSAGQQSTKYGKIEDMCASVTVVTPAEIFSTLNTPASAAGPSIKDLLIGSEGLYGVITQAQMRIHKLPATRLYRVVLFKDFAAGAQAIRRIIQEDLTPATVRLSDEFETAAFMKMRAESDSVLTAALTKVGRFWLKNRGYLDNSSLMILGFEDSESRVHQESKAALEICRQYDGIDLGARAGRLWYKDRFELPYLRDLLLDRAVLIDTLETATTWRNLMNVYQRVREALHTAIVGFHWQAKPLVFCHISHSYRDGASLYFTFLARQAQGAEIAQWQAAKTAASEAIVASGATISHHHGVGRDHACWARYEHGRLGTEGLTALKRTFDPTGILNPGKLLP